MIPVMVDSMPQWLDSFLLTLGYHGDLTDGMECIYVPISNVIAIAIGIPLFWMCVVWLVQNDREIHDATN